MSDNIIIKKLPSGSAEPATPSEAGIVKLYDDLGENTDGTITQAAITQAIESGGGGEVKTFVLDYTVETQEEFEDQLDQLEAILPTINEYALYTKTSIQLYNGIVITPEDDNFAQLLASFLISNVDEYNLESFVFFTWEDFIARPILGYIKDNEDPNIFTGLFFKASTGGLSEDGVPVYGSICDYLYVVTTDNIDFVLESYNNICLIGSLTTSSSIGDGWESIIDELNTSEDLIESNCNLISHLLLCETFSFGTGWFTLNCSSDAIQFHLDQFISDDGYEAQVTFKSEDSKHILTLTYSISGPEPEDISYEWSHSTVGGLVYSVSDIIDNPVGAWTEMQNYEIKDIKVWTDEITVTDREGNDIWIPGGVAISTVVDGNSYRFLFLGYDWSASEFKLDAMYLEGSSPEFDEKYIGFVQPPDPPENE